jgi:hypothetical protein
MGIFGKDSLDKLKERSVKKKLEYLAKRIDPLQRNALKEMLDYGYIGHSEHTKKNWELIERSKKFYNERIENKMVPVNLIAECLVYAIEKESWKGNSVEIAKTFYPFLERNYSSNYLDDLLEEVYKKDESGQKNIKLPL